MANAVKQGRPSKYTPELAGIICERVVMRSLHAVSSDEDMPEEATIYRWLGLHAEFQQNYARAREVRGYRRAEGIDAVVSDMRLKEISPEMARVEIDAIKWQSARENPKALGDRTVLAGDADAPLLGLSDEQVDARLAAFLAK